MTHTALIVAHGQPSDPAPAEASLAALAADVAAHLPGWRVLSATLAAEGRLAAMVNEAGLAGGVVYPMFMADGWFTRQHLPERLAKACHLALFGGATCGNAACGGAGGCARWYCLPPFGLDTSVQTLALRVLHEAGVPPGGEVLLAAHGSGRSAAPSDVANAVASRLKEGLLLSRCDAAFIDQQPRLAEVSGFGPDAVCLPFFAAEGEHVTDDLPAALAEAGFTGRVLPPLGRDARVPGLIATALRAGAEASGH
ncbi:MAG: CbiX/SirB N-terminal domain-containing protein [Pseudotabrizicola sp.]|uniref:CbiX/SirB N-terminal domain-containing protein n=1 Tax=Pseudotabrizicola sp. TaxID=2939647 RepID=UPI002731F334|nr:CbiX/SirB N-terminal domain-containing protein [Pseudotabrizicola sp.]MDP2079906.1 CbiX/SirB N-terminal domain-containing protein [Pseudotabrizicola sp.]MDZ7575645.1 CbiX/SirB N-terminal domain-containing protein [Pseudotabrizicola sp.]